MTIEHTNRKGQTYYLHGREDKRGTMRYFFSKKKGEDTVDEIPEGYEIYENIGGQVFLRKERPSPFTEEEHRQVEEAIEEHAPGSRFEVKDDAFVIYERESPFDDPRMADMFGMRFGNVDDEKLAQYIEVLRFELIDNDSRMFSAERFHFSRDRWFPLDSGSLADLLEEYLPHVGEESFFELI